MKTYHSTIEPLESRIAPAAVFVSATTATYTDVDGDHVTVKFSLPILTTGNVAAVLETASLGGGDQLQEINLSGVTLPVPTPPLSITVSAVKAAHSTGDGLVNVGLINATGINLSIVTIKGDLGAVEAGDSSATTPAIKSLDVRSMGAYGTATQAAAGPTLTSTIDGTLTALNVSADVTNVYIDVTGGFTTADAGNIGSIHIGGSLIGGNTTNGGNISTTVSGTIGPVKIGGDILGGSGSNSGQIDATGAITSVTLGGSIVGSSGPQSGQINSALGGINSLTIGGSIIGGSGEESGNVEVTGKLGTVKVGGSLLGVNDASNFGGGTLHAISMGSVTIGGSVIGGTATFSSEIIAFGPIGSVTIGGSLIGAAGTQTGAILTSQGSSEAPNIGPVKIGGSLIGEGAGSKTDSGEIDSGANIASVTIGGSLVGGSVTRSGYIFSAGATGAVRIGKDIFGGEVSGTSDSGEINSGGSLGPVTVGGSLIGGSASYSAEILSAGTMGAVRIGGNLVGGPVQDSGGIQAHGDLAAVMIGGSVYSGTALFTGEIESEATLGLVTIKGNVAGNAADPVLIRGQGEVNTAMTTDIAIAGLSVGGRVEGALILAGFGGGNSPQSGNAQIGTVRVGGDWIASSISAGCEDTASGGISGGFGYSSDFQIPTLPGGSIDSRIASITIGGTIVGDAGAGDHFGFDAQKIGSFSYSGTTITLPTTQPPAINDTIPLSLTTGDVTIELVL